MFSGVQYSTQCFCGTEIAKRGKKISYRKCNRNCPGKRNQKCGGTWAMNIYNGSGRPCEKDILIVWNISPILEIDLGKRPPVTRCPLGCYKDQGRRLLPSSFVNLSRNSPRACANHCRREGYRFSGVEYRTQCFCGHGISNKSIKYPSSKCNYKCPRDKNQKCGGVWAINVSELLIGRGKKCKLS